VGSFLQDSPEKRIQGGHLARSRIDPEEGGFLYSEDKEDVAQCQIGRCLIGDGASFVEKVTINVISGCTGIKFPCGTKQLPTNNLDDAISIANSRGIKVLSVVGNLTINYNHDISEFIIQGQSQAFSTITLETGCITEKTQFRSCTLIGEVNGAIEANNCELGEMGNNISNVGTTTAATMFNNCIIHNIDLSSTATEELILNNCASADPSDIHPFHPLINHNNSTVEIGIRNYFGGIMFANMTDQYGRHSVDMSSGRVHIQSTCTEGAMTIRGITLLLDESGPNFTVNAEGVADAWNQLITDHEIPNSFGKKLIDILKLKRTKP